ncbi:MAG: DoxX protein [Opitutales bacterium]
MKDKIDRIVEVVLGLILLIFGLNKFIGFMSMPEMPEPAGNFMGALAQSGYMMPVIAITELAVGALLVSGFYRALALVLLAPLSVHLILFHLALAPATILPALIVAALNVYLLFKHINAYRPLLQQRA